MLDIVGKRSWFFVIAAVVILIGVISMVTIGLKPGIEFSSGSMMTLRFEQQQVIERELRSELAGLGYGNAIVQTTGEGDCAPAFFLSFGHRFFVHHQSPGVSRIQDSNRVFNLRVICSA